MDREHTVVLGMGRSLVTWVANRVIAIRMLISYKLFGDRRFVFENTLALSFLPTPQVSVMWDAFVESCR